MKKRKFYIVWTLLLIVAFLLCMGVACNNQESPDETAKPPTSLGATASPTPTPELNSATASATPTTGDNEVEVPDIWGDLLPTEDNVADNTEKPVEKTPTPASTPPSAAATETSATDETTNSPSATATSNSTSGTATTPTPNPTTEAPPIGTDEDGFIDFWC